MDLQVLAILGASSLVLGALLYGLIRFGVRKSRGETPPARDPRLRFTGAGSVFIGFMVICWIGFSAWAMLAFGMSGRSNGPFVIMVVALLVALVFGALCAALNACGVKFTKETR